MIALAKTETGRFGGLTRAMVGQTNGIGFLNKDEFRDAVRCYHFAVTDETIDALFQRANVVCARQRCEIRLLFLCGM